MKNRNRENCYTVYIHISPNDKKYIGITSQNVKQRWQSGYGYRGNDYFYKAIQKYGWDNFEHKILFENLTKEEAEQKEIELIALYKSNQRQYGYNIDSGGHSVGRMSDETKEKISKSHIGILAVPVCQYLKDGTFVREYSSVNIAADEVGVTYTAISACCRNIMKTVNGYIWRYKGDELTKEYIDWCNSDSRTKRGNSIKQYSLSGQFIAEYQNIEQAGKILHFSTPNIRACCKKTKKTSNGYIWRYSNDTLTEDNILWCNSDEKSKQVIKSSQDGTVLEIYQSITIASKENNISIQSIWSCCNSYSKTAGGYLWRYK